MKFVVASDRPITITVEPYVSRLYELRPDDEVMVEWEGAREDGRVELAGQQLVLHVPTVGTLRAWNARGTEIWFGPEAGPDAE
jgi:hypothetical protein